MTKTRSKKYQMQGIDLEDIAQAYADTGTIEGVCAIYGFAPRTVRKYLDAAGVRRKRGPKKGRSTQVPRSHHGCLAQWIKTHPEESLPASPQEIAKITGCSENEVKTYLYRKTKDLKKAVKNFPDLPRYPKQSWTDVFGTAIPGAAIRRGVWSYNRRNFLVSYTAELRSGSYRKFTKPIEEWELAFEALSRTKTDSEEPQSQ